MRVPDRTGVIVGYRVWRVLPSPWIPPSESLHAQTGHWSWSLDSPTTAVCPPRLREKPRDPPDGPCDAPPGWGCRCGLYARYEPPEEPPRLPFVAGGILAWGKIIHHQDDSFFRAEKALPVAFVQPSGGDGLFPEEAEEKLYRVAQALEARMVENPAQLREFTREEAKRW